jgi:hypothetical protein
MVSIAFRQEVQRIVGPVQLCPVDSLPTIVFAFEQIVSTG